MVSGNKWIERERKTCPCPFSRKERRKKKRMRRSVLDPRCGIHGLAGADGGITATSGGSLSDEQVHHTLALPRSSFFFPDSGRFSFYFSLSLSSLPVNESSSDVIN